MGWASAMSCDKVNNHPKSAGDKVAIRRRVLKSVPCAKVFDAFAGSGRMWRSVWRNAQSYVGCDLKWYKDRVRLAYVGDNRRVLRSVDLSEFNIFDLDAYGSPWEQATIIAARRMVKSGELVGLVLTEGSLMKLKLGKAPVALALLAGIGDGARGLARQYEQIMDRAISALCARMRCDLVARYQAEGKTQSGVHYIGLILRGQ